MQKKRPSSDIVATKHFDSTGCPFREFKDTELGVELWGLGPESVIQKQSLTKHSNKSSVMDNSSVWEDEQMQPLPRSVRKYFHEWIKAEELAARWDATVVVSKDSAGTENNKMRSYEFQLIYSSVLQRSSFCRKVLSCCYLLERVENFNVEHQWENFICAVGADGWLPRLHILSPGMKPGGGSLHKPTLSKSGCYLVRLYYLGSWRCVWVNDLVPLDEKENPLLPFAQPPVAPVVSTGKNVKPQNVPPGIVQLWPLLLCKALLKLAAIDMDDIEGNEDETLEHLDIMHCLTGGLSLRSEFLDQEKLWSFMTKETAVFEWEDNPNESSAGAMRAKAAKKPAKNATDALKARFKRKSIVCMELMDTLGVPSYELPGLTPAYDLNLLAIMIRDLPLIRPPPEPVLPLWKTFRWIHWARSHGLYDEYECPRKRWVKSVGLLRLSRAPHLLDVRSTESISNTHAKDLDKTRKRSDTTTLSKGSARQSIPGQTLETMEWVDYRRLFNYVQQVNVVYLPSMHEYFSVGNALAPRLPTKATEKASQAKPVVGPVVTYLQAPTNAPLYLQLDSKEPIAFRISLSTIHPNVLKNSGYPLKNYIKPAHLVLEKFDWLADEKKSINASAYLETRSYDTLEIKLPPGRHIFRLWVTSALIWHCCILTEASLNLCKRNIAFGLANAECPWATQKLSMIDSSFSSWIKSLPVRNLFLSRQLYKSYAPDLYWNPKKVGNPQTDVHSMFRKALSKFLQARLSPTDFDMARGILRNALLDPYFGLSEPLGASLETLDIFRNACEISRAKCFCDVSVNVDLDEESDLLDTASSLNDENIQYLQRFVVHTKSNDCINCNNIINKIENILLKHKAAVVIQSNWRRILCRRMYKNNTLFYTDVAKMISDQVCSATGVSALMNTFFELFPEVRSAYSISSALGGRYRYQQYPGVSTVTSKDVWIPLFIGTFYCHSSVRVHFDLECILRKCTVFIIDNDTRTEVPVAVNSHNITYHFNPNINGYDVHAQAWRTSTSYNQMEEIPWKLTLLSSEEGSFHVCDNAPNCEELLLTGAHKFDLEESFVPNRRNILGGVQMLVVKPASLSIRVTTNYPELNVLAILREKGKDLAIATCCGRGELFWSPVALDSTSIRVSGTSSRNNYGPQILDIQDHASVSSKASKQTKKPTSGTTRAKSGKSRQPLSPVGPEPRAYEIEVIAPQGWPLTSAQWMKVEELWDPPAVTRPSSAKRGKQVDIEDIQHSEVLNGDATCRLEVSMGLDNPVTVQRDNRRDLAWSAELNSWDRGARHARGAVIRDKFRTKYLIPAAELEEALASKVMFQSTDVLMTSQQRTSQMGEIFKSMSSFNTSIIERYLTKPAHLQDKFYPLDFVPLCTKEELPESITLTPEAVEEARLELHARMEAAQARSEELQQYNLQQVIAGQRRRNRLLDTLFVDGSWRPLVYSALQARDEAAGGGGAVPRRSSSRSLRGKKK